MTASNTHIADLLDTVHHEMDSVVYSYHVYESVWSPVIQQFVLGRSLLVNPHNEFPVAVVAERFSDSGLHSL